MALKKKKLEGDGATPEGTYSLGPLYYRSDRIKTHSQSDPRLNAARWDDRVDRIRSH